MSQGNRSWTDGGSKGTGVPRSKAAAKAVAVVIGKERCIVGSLGLKVVGARYLSLSMHVLFPMDMVCTCFRVSFVFSPKLLNLCS